MNLPHLNSYHTIDAAQTTVDPLGLVSLSGKLSNRLTPGLRERMSHPRYLTAMAVGAIVCSAFDEDELATDEVTAPWQVYEWYVASSLVRRFEKEGAEQLSGMPGRQKTISAMRKSIHLSKNAYLTNPSVNGFHGVYKTLAKNMTLLDGNGLGEFGISLIDAWEKEQRLDGFQRGGKDSPGRIFRDKLQKAVRDGLTIAAVDRTWNWDTYTILADSLAPKNPGKEEANLIFQELKNGSSGKREELISFLMSAEGQDIIENKSEKDFHSALIKRLVGIAPLLKAIRSYEKFCNLLFNAFYEIMQWASDHQNKGTLETFSSLPTVKRATAELPWAFAEANELMETYTEEARILYENFNSFSNRNTSTDFVRILFEHHTRIQRNKVPIPKAPWVIEHVSNSYLVNSFQDLRKKLDDDYVHVYRTASLQSFLKDLGKI
ncbi:MAG: hypothetical protein WKF70_14430 [Chitinophagaceae bacterium]